MRMVVRAECTFSYTQVYIFLQSLIIGVVIASTTDGISDYTQLDQDRQKDVQSVMDKWKWKKALNREAGGIISSQVATLNLDESDIRIEKYSVSVENATYAVVHLQKKLSFDASVIRAAFETSRDTRSHVLFTAPFGVHSNPERLQYYSCQLSNKLGFPYWVWLLPRAMDKFKSKGRVANCEELKSTRDFMRNILSQ